MPDAKTFFFVVNSNNEIAQNGYIVPTGQCRMIKMTSADNIRDLGGWACDGGTVKYGKLFRGGEVYGWLTDYGKAQALELLGIRKEIDLRFPEDLNGRTESGFGPEVDMLWVDMTWNALVQQKIDGHIKAIFDPLFDYIIAGKPTYFHCSAGADRTGVVALLCEAVLGVSQSDMDKDYELTNFYTGASTDAEARRRNETVWTREINYINTYDGTTFRDKTVNFMLSCGITLEKINAFRKAMINGSPADLTANLSTYSVTKTLTGINTDSTVTSVTQYQPFVATLTTDSNKVIDSIKVTMGGTDITPSVFKGSKSYLRRGVTQNLTLCTSTNKRNYVIDGQSYATKLKADSGYALSTVTIAMGGIDVSTTYYHDGIISIPEVTGDIVITATTVTQGPLYTNLLDTAINMNGEVIGHTPMYTNKRWNSSSGDPVDYTGTNITGLIPVTKGDTVRVRWNGKNDDTYQSIKFFKADKTQCATGYCSLYSINTGMLGNVIQKDSANGILDFDLTKTNAHITDCAYMAIVVYGDITNMIVTVNEEIDE